VWISWENLDTDHLKLLSIDEGGRDNIKIDLKEIGWKGINWIHLVQFKYLK
jgi:hypothetical protein